MSTPDSDDPRSAVLQAEVETLRELVAAQQALIARLQEQVRDLTEQLHRNSGNSSRPPSSDPPWRARPRKPPSGKKRGGQPGHPGQYRRLLPPEAVDHRVVVIPPACAHCGAAFSAELPRCRKFRRHQVVELPPIRPVVTEYELHARRCACCGKRTWASLPLGVSRRCVGPRVPAIVALLSGACRLSRRQVQDLLGDLFGVKLALGTVSALERDTAQALAAPYQELAETIPRAGVLHVDETSWREAGTLHWIWTAVTRQFAFFRVDRHRNRAALEALLGNVAPTAGDVAAADPADPADAVRPAEPVLITDRYSAYNHLLPERRSFCWAHLARDFRAVSERGGVDAAVGRWGLELLGQILEAWREHRAGKQSREACRTRMSELQERLKTPLRWGSEQGTRATRALCGDLLERWEYLWTWLEVEEGEPTNNRAERALRQAVLWRKSSYGHQSETGEQYVERMLTVTGTLRLQGRNLWEYLVDACEAAIRGEAAPSLLPQASS